nr:MAG TPA: hypothetical protein [Caudoviricetes sp.]
MPIRYRYIAGLYPLTGILIKKIRDRSVVNFAD